MSLIVGIWVMTGFFGGLYSYQINKDTSKAILHGLTGPFYFIYGVNHIEVEKAKAGMVDPIDKAFNTVVKDTYRRHKKKKDADLNLKIKSDKLKVKELTKEKSKLEKQIKKLQEVKKCLKERR